MSRGRFLVDPLLLPFTPPAFDLLTTATQLDLVGDHWKLGIQWPVRCPEANGTYGECVALDDAPVPPAKTDTWNWEFRGATPITVYSQVSCAPVGRWEDLGPENQQALLKSEVQELERIFWTGEVVDGSGSITGFPHLADSAVPVFDGDDLLQIPSQVITTIPQDIHVGIGMLEGAMRDCYAGAATLHIPSRLIEPAAWGGGLTVRSGVLYTTLGSKIVAGNYPGTAPDGTATPGVTWIYATGTVFYQREPVPHSFRPVESFDRDVNTLSMIAERTYVIGWDCCQIAIPILNGEDTTP